jgi:hypothetical protein
LGCGELRGDRVVARVGFSGRACALGSGWSRLSDSGLKFRLIFKWDSVGSVSGTY